MISSSIRIECIYGSYVLVQYLGSSFFLDLSLELGTRVQKKIKIYFFSVFGYSETYPESFSQICDSRASTIFDFLRDSLLIILFVMNDHWKSYYSSTIVHWFGLGLERFVAVWWNVLCDKSNMLDGYKWLLQKSVGVYASYFWPLYCFVTSNAVSNAIA